MYNVFSVLTGFISDGVVVVFGRSFRFLLGVFLATLSVLLGVGMIRWSVGIWSVAYGENKDQPYDIVH